MMEWSENSLCISKNDIFLLCLLDYMNVVILHYYSFLPNIRYQRLILKQHGISKVLFLAQNLSFFI